MSGGESHHNPERHSVRQRGRCQVWQAEPGRTPTKKRVPHDCECNPLPGTPNHEMSRRCAGGGRGDDFRQVFEGRPEGNQRPDEVHDGHKPGEKRAVTSPTGSPDLEAALATERDQLLHRRSVLAAQGLDRRDRCPHRHEARGVPPTSLGIVLPSAAPWVDGGYLTPLMVHSVGSLGPSE